MILTATDDLNTIVISELTEEEQITADMLGLPIRGKKVVITGANPNDVFFKARDAKAQIQDTMGRVQKTTGVTLHIDVLASLGHHLVGLDIPLSEPDMLVVTYGKGIDGVNGGLTRMQSQWSFSGFFEYEDWRELFTRIFLRELAGQGMSEDYAHGFIEQLLQSVERLHDAALDGRKVA